MWLNYEMKKGGIQMPQIDWNVLKLYAKEATRMCLSGNRNVVEPYERKVPCECTNATAMSLSYNQPQRAAIAS